MAEEVVATIVVKLTYTGPQNKTIPSLLFIKSGCEVPVQEFKDLNLYYSNDEVLSQTFSVSQEIMKQIETVILTESLDDQAEEENQVLTVVMLYVGLDKYQQINLSRQRAGQVMARIYDSTAGEKDINEALDIWLSRTDLNR